MPRADKAAFIQNMLSELELKQNGTAPTKPEPDSKEWWREVAQGLGVECAALQRENAALRIELERMRDDTLPALRVSLETEILPGLRASAQVWEAQRAERAVRLLIAALASTKEES